MYGLLFKNEKGNAVRLNGGIVQVKNTIYTTQTGWTAVVIPYDNSIPQNTEGTEVMTLAFTPKFSDSRFAIFMQFNGSTSDSSRGFSMALFQDSNAGALNAVLSSTYRAAASGNEVVTLIHDMANNVGKTTTTFKMRVGNDSGACMIQVNQADSTGTPQPKYGGVMGCVISVIEYLLIT